MAMTRAIINVPPELHAQWKAVAAYREESMSDIARKLLENWLSKPEQEAAWKSKP